MGRFKILAVGIVFGLIMAAVAIATKDTAFGEFLKDKMKIIIIVFAIVAVAVGELAKRKH